MKIEDQVGVAFSRIYASSDGESHFEDVVVETTRVTVAPEATGAMASPIPVGELTFASMDAGYHRPWHAAPRRQFAFVSSGELEVTASDGESRRFGPGSVFLAEDTTGNGHRTRAVGSGGCVVVFVACQ
jgi:hypothetical protein